MNKNTTSKDYYGILGVDKNASKEEIVKAFRKLARTHHPDKGGSETKFQEINEAYEVLSDPTKRKRYDIGPQQDERQGPFGFSSQNFGSSNIFETFFNQGSFSNEFRTNNQFTSRPKRKPSTENYFIEVSLEDLYLGCDKKVKVPLKRVCEGCLGTTVYPPSDPILCSCRGTGYQIYSREIMPGFFQRIRAVCQECKGLGSKKQTSSKTCELCQGSGDLEITEDFEIKIQPGTKEGEIIVFEGKGNQISGGSMKDQPISGDLAFIVKQLPHPQFTRNGDDLYMKLDIPLVDSLTGFTLTFDRLDRSTFRKPIKEVIQPGQVLTFENEGMKKKSSDLKGNLYVEFSVSFPKVISASKKAQIKTLLENPTETYHPVNPTNSPNPSTPPVHNHDPSFFGKTKNFLKRHLSNL